MKDRIEQTKDPVHRSHYNQRSQNALFLACAATLLQHTLTFSEGTIVKLNVTSRERFLRPACNSHPFGSDAWPLKASKVQLNLPGDRAKNSGSLLEGKKLLSLTQLFVSPSTSQLLSPECHSHDSPCSAQCPKNKVKPRYMLCLAELIFSLLA